MTRQLIGNRKSQPDTVSRRAGTRGSQSGMTLIEVLISLVLFSMLSVGLLSAFRLGQHSYRQLVTLNSDEWNIVRTQRLLRRVIESSYPFHHSNATIRQYGLEGSRDRLSITAPMPVAAGARGYYRYEFVLTPATNGTRTLVARSELDRGGAVAGPADSTRQEELLANIEDVEWSFLEPPASNDARVKQSPRWVQTWNSRPDLPMLVRLRLRFREGDRRIWPELIAVPRVTNDAQCEFDVVSQVCREAGS